MPTELESRAAEAWAMMSRKTTIFTTLAGDREPMPPAVALDYVQDVCGDRDDAMIELMRVASHQLSIVMPTWGSGEVHRGCKADAELICSYLREESPGLATVHLVHIRDCCYMVTHPGYLAPDNASPRDRHEALDWNRWADKAMETIDRARAVVDAVYPTETVN